MLTEALNGAKMRGEPWSGLKSLGSRGHENRPDARSHRSKRASKQPVRRGCIAPGFGSGPAVPDSPVRGPSSGSGSGSVPELPSPTAGRSQSPLRCAIRDEVSRHHHRAGGAPLHVGCGRHQEHLGAGSDLGVVARSRDGLSRLLAIELQLGTRLRRVADDSLYLSLRSRSRSFWEVDAYIRYRSGDTARLAMSLRLHALRSKCFVKFAAAIVSR